MPDEEPRLEAYQFSEYAGTPPGAQYGQGNPPVGPFPPQQVYPVPYPPYAFVPPAVPVPGKPLLFPLTRGASLLKQFVSMAVYSVLMVALFVGSIVAIALNATDPKPGDLFLHADGTANGPLIAVSVVFVLLVLPAISLLAGAFFGAARAFLVVCIVEGATLGLGATYASAQQQSFQPNLDLLTIGLLALLPLTALLVGRIYDYRRSAAWWKSFLSMLAGSALFIVALIVLTLGTNSSSNAVSQTNVAAGFIGFGCLFLVGVPLIALPIAAIEGLAHAILAARRGRAGVTV